MRKEKERADYGHEVISARDRLEGALQVLIEKTESETSEESDVDVTDVLNESRRSLRIAVNSPSSSPRKTPGSALKTPVRKHRKINVEKSLKSDQQTYVLKLYDRSVDLAQFSPNTSLYPVCRAWIKNQPNTTNSGTKTSTKSDPAAVEPKEEATIKFEDKEDDVKSLPLPSFMPTDSDGQLIDTRIPANLKPPQALGSPDFLNKESGPSVQLLLSEHLSHWWEVRRQWRQAAAVNETRYARSTSILKSILVRP